MRSMTSLTAPRQTKQGLTRPGLIVGLVAGLALSACASSGTPSRYTQDFTKLRDDCTAREGVLVPTTATTGEPERDYACRISGGATRIN